MAFYYFGENHRVIRDIVATFFSRFYAKLYVHLISMVFIQNIEVKYKVLKFYFYSLYLEYLCNGFKVTVYLSTYL